MMIPALLIVLSGLPRETPPPQPAAAADTTLARLPERVLRDLARLAGRTPLITLGVGGLVSAAAWPADPRAVPSPSTSATLDRTFAAGGVAGDGAVQAGAAAAVYAIGLARGSRRTQELGTALLEAQGVEGLITQGLKHTVRRARPDGGRYSFPSGHTAASFATAEVLRRRYGWKAGLAMYVAAAYISASRIADRRHYLTDVLFGASIGIAAAHTPQHNH
jgi:membrane-associated phospholipid phosphatase